ncbi:unnamed protein product, partial [Ixodes pacificus]
MPSKSPLSLQLNPFHKVPTIDDNGFVLYESFAICSYLLDAYGAKSDLKVDCVKTRARVNQVLAVITSTVQPQFFKFFRPRFFELKKPTSAEIEELEKNILGGLQQLLGDGKYVVGDKLTVADLSLVAHLTLPVEVRHRETSRLDYWSKCSHRLIVLSLLMEASYRFLLFCFCKLHSHRWPRVLA